MNARPAYSVFGERHTILLTGEETGGDYAVIEAIVLPGGGPPYHVHDAQDEAFVVMRGTFEFALAGRTVRVPPGGTLSIPRGVPHTFTVVGEEPGAVVVTVSPAGLERYFAEIGTPLTTRDEAPPPFSPEQVERAVGLMPRYGMALVPPPPPAAGPAAAA